MKQKIDKLSRGIFEYSIPKIVLSEECIQISAVVGTDYKGSFTIRNSKGTRMKGVLYSSCRLLTLSTTQFIGEEIRVEYTFRAGFLDPADKVTGSINIITDCGETELPFEAVIRPPFCVSSIGEIRDLFQLANLAKADWDEAEHLFASEELRKSLPYFDKELVETYNHLSPDISVGHALEELLVSTRKKVPVKITVDKNRLDYNAGMYSFLDKITLTRNTWGYSEYEISTDAPFIRTRNTLITTKMFNGKNYVLDIVIDPAKLHGGLNLGKIIIESVNEHIEIPVACRCKRSDSAEAVQIRRIKQHYSRLTSNYLRFRLNRQSLGRYVNEAENIVTGLENIEGFENEYIDIYRAHLLLSEGKEQPFKALLSKLQEESSRKKDDPMLRAGVLYLGAMSKKNAEATDTAVRDIRALYAMYPEKWMLLWFLLYLDKNYNTPKRRIDAIFEAFMNGARSPIMYFEAAAAYNEDPESFSNIRIFELEVLNFAVRNTMLAQGIAARVAFAASKYDEYSKLLERILRKLYEIYPTKEILTAICHISMLGRRFDTRSHFYYSLAVAGELNIQGIHEAYIESAPKDISVLLEHSALNYFAYNCPLDDDRKAYLYANVVRFSSDYAFIWKTYEPQIREFTVRMLKEGAINSALAYLYDNIVPQLPLTAELASYITNVCFMYEIRCNSRELVSVFVSHKELEEEVRVPIVNGIAYIELYTEKAEVVFGDKADRRFLSSVDYQINKLVHLDGLLEQCSFLDEDNPKLLLHTTEKMRYEQRRDEESVELMKCATRIHGLRKEYIRDYVKELIYYYYENFEGDLLENYLLQIDLKTIDHKERTKIIEFMIIRDLYNVALKALDEYGFEGIDVKRLMKLCSRLLLNAGGMEKVDVLVAACFCVFREGRYDETIVRYLTDYYYGTTSEMFELWKAARTFEIDTEDLEERLLGQMLFAESYVSNARAVFMNYYRGGENRTLIRAFLSYYAYKYLVTDRLVEPEIFDIMRSELSYDENEVCLLAVLKYYSTCEQLSDSEVNFVDYHINRLEQREIVLPFFASFKGNMRIPQDICDKYYVEYRTAPSSTVKIHYYFDNGSGSFDYIEEEMRHVCYGIYVKEFVLFGNESLQYYITEGEGESETITESTEVRLNPEQSMEEDTKYYQLNMIISAREMQDEKTALKLIDSYLRTDYAISKLFQPISE